MGEISSSKQQTDRRKRINRMKKGFVLFIGVWMLISMILCIVLLFKVIRLENKLDTLTNSTQISQKVSLQKNAASSEKTDLYSSSGDAKMQSTEDSDNNSSVEAVTTDVSSAVETDKENLAGVDDKRKVYLTFDDGPSNNTSAILDTLDKYNVKATFFVIGKTDDQSKALYQRIVSEGDTLGMHSYSHKYSVIYNSLDSFESDFHQIQDYLYQVTGVKCNLYRFPGGSSNQVSNISMTEFIKYLKSENVTYYDWNVSSGDATSQAYTPDQLVENVMKDVVKYKTSVVLMHDSDTKTATVEALGPMIEALQKTGVEILPIDGNTKVVQHIKAESVN